MLAFIINPSFERWKRSAQVIHSEYLQQSYPYIVGAKTLIIITTAGLRIEMFFLAHKVQERQKFLDCEGSLNFLKYVTLLSLKKKKITCKILAFLKDIST